MGKVLFLYRYGPFLPSGVSGTTQVIKVFNGPPPRGVSNSYSRQIREYFGCYYPEYVLYGRWWDCFPKALTDVLEEYGAQAQDGKLLDASGRELLIVKKWPTPSGPENEWLERQRISMPYPCILVVVDIPEND
jgi:hypothetical protein